MHHDIVFVYPFARLNRTFCKANDLAEFHNRLTVAQSCKRHFMSARNTHGGRRAVDDRTRLNRINGDGNIVGGVQPDKTGR